MARIGFKKVYAPATFDKAAMLEIFNAMKSWVINAGFTVVLDTATAIDFLRMGSPAGTAHDDIPHWALVYEDLGSYSRIYASAVFGHDYLDVGAFCQPYTIASTNWLNSPAPEITLWFAVDAVEGWWWLNGTIVRADSPSGHEIKFCGVGASTRRYPADMNQGLCSRYGVWDDWGDWCAAYTRDETGVQYASPWAGTWSVFGEGWTYNSIRHPGSPLGKMAVPQFPNRDGGFTASVLGEFREILVLTDGYVSGEAPLPGWIAFVGNERDQPYAVPAPDSFTVL